MDCERTKRRWDALALYSYGAQPIGALHHAAKHDQDRGFTRRVCRRGCAGFPECPDGLKEKPRNFENLEKVDDTARSLLRALVYCIKIKNKT